MSIYTHTLRGQETEAIRQLPDLSSPSTQSQKATGTDDIVADSAYKPAYKKLAKNASIGCQQSSLIGTINKAKYTSVEGQGEMGKSLEMAELGTKKEPVSSTDTDTKKNGRWGIRTHDPLIKSQ